MIRLFGILTGLVFAGVALISFVAGFIAWASEEHVETAEHVFHKAPEDVAFSFDGPLGKWDNVQLQRGYKVYKEVCAACHSLKFVAFRDLQAIGYSEAQVKVLAAEWQVPEYNASTGEVETEAGLPTDNFPPVPYFGQGNPPDLSLITKARHDGTNYVHSLLTGYADAATYKNDEGVSLKEEFPDFETPPGAYFNPYFPNLNLSMAAPLTAAGQVTYDDGTEATVDQMSQDVAAFLAWTAEPKMQERKKTGWWFIGFLFFATILAYLAYKNIWAGVKPKKSEAD